MLIKKGWCYCKQCGPRTFRDKSDGLRTKSKGTSSHKDSAHKLWIRQLRSARINKDGELMFDKAVGYTD